MNSVIRFKSQNRDKNEIFRVAQYTTRLIWAFKEKFTDEDAVRHLKLIEDNIIFSRQALRFGKCIQVLNSSLDSMYIHDNLLRTTETLSQISNSLYLLCDNLIWLSKVGIISIDEKRFNRLANSYLLYSSILILIKNIYKMKLLYKNQKLMFPIQRFENIERQILRFLYYNKLLSLDIIANLCDICIYMNSLQKLRISSVKIGVLGLISSLIPIFKHNSLTFF